MKLIDLIAAIGGDPESEDKIQICHPGRRCEPFCWSMPLTEYYIDRCEMEVVGSILDNPELLQEESNE